MSKKERDERNRENYLERRRMQRESSTQRKRKSRKRTNTPKTSTSTTRKSTSTSRTISQRAKTRKESTPRPITRRDHVKSFYSNYIDSQRIEVIPNFYQQNEINNNAFFYDLPDNFVLFIGRLSRTKGVDVLIEAYKKID